MNKEEKEIYVTFLSSWGNLSVCEDGSVISIDGPEEIDGERNYLYDIVSVDMKELKSFYKTIGKVIPDLDDMLNIGFTSNDGEYSEPNHEWRERISIKKINSDLFPIY